MRILFASAAALVLWGAAGSCLADLTGFDRDFAADAFRLNLSAIQDSQWGNESTQPESVKLLAQRIIKDHSAALARLKQIAIDKDLKLPTMPTKRQENAREDLKKQEGQTLRVNYIRRQIEQRQEEVNLCE